MQPLPAHFSDNLLVRNEPPSRTIRQAPIDGLHHVEVVQHVVQAAVVWQFVEKSPNGVFGRHQNLAHAGLFEYTAAPCAAKFSSEGILFSNQQAHARVQLRAA